MRQRRPPRPEYLRLVEPGAIIPPPGRPRQPRPAPTSVPLGGAPRSDHTGAGSLWPLVGFVAGIVAAAILIAVVEAFR